MFEQVIKSLFNKKEKIEQVPFVMYGKGSEEKEIFSGFNGFNALERQCAKILYDFNYEKEESIVK